MTLRRDDLNAVPTEQNLFEVRCDGNALQPFLGIQPPDNASKTPPILAFRRKREVEIPWSEIVGDEDVTGGALIAAIRKYFEDSWGFDVDEKWMNDSTHHLLDTGSGSWRVKQLQKDEPSSIFRPDFDKLSPEGKPTPVQLSEGFVVRHGPSDGGRLYRLINHKKTLSPEHFKSFELYNSAWKHDIDGIELVFESAEDAQSCYMDFEEIDLRPVLIQRKFEELRILRDFARKVKSNVAGITEKMISQMTQTTLDPDELEQLQRKLLRLEIGEYDVQRRIERLASDASRLGYLLCLQDEPVEQPDVKGGKLEAGKLYTTFRRTARWTVYESRHIAVKVGWWIFRRTAATIDFKVPRPKEQVVQDYRAVDTSKDVLAETRAAMIKAGQQVYIFEQTPSGLVSTQGEPLHQIMDRCKYDEQFRRECVVMLPVYEESLTGQRLVAKYAIYKRPLPGLVPNILPRMALEESLTYRTAWVQTQLGELLNSINLAPDEERKVTITKRFEQETTVTRTSTSIFDISRAETTDLATEMENQTRQEQESSRSMQLSTKASGGYGPFSAEASASGGMSSSLKDMSQAISKVASKAAKSVSSQNREEVTSTSTARTTISNTDETIATIRNINQGRSLNLMFYRLYNKYEGGLFLERLRFDVVPSVEVIAGSGVHESKSYSLEELPRMIDEFKSAQLPFAIRDEDEYTDRLVESIDTLLRTEYEIDREENAGARKLASVAAAAGGGAPAEPHRQAMSVSVARLSVPPPRTPQTGPQAGHAGADSKLLKSRENAKRSEEAGFAAAADSKLADLSDRLRRTVILSDEPIAPQSLLVAAPGLYLDAAVGVQPSTEPYSERMREQTVALKMAEVALTQADARYRESLAQHLIQTCGNWIIGITPHRERNSLIFTLKFPLASGKWEFVLDGKTLCQVQPDQIGNYTVNLKWDTQQQWLEDDGLMNRCLELQDREKGVVLRRV